MSIEDNFLRVEETQIVEFMGTVYKILLPNKNILKLKYLVKPRYIVLVIYKVVYKQCRFSINLQNFIIEKITVSTAIEN